LKIEFVAAACLLRRFEAVAGAGKNTGRQTELISRWMKFMTPRSARERFQLEYTEGIILAGER
jgi:hypothetical protein